MKKEDCVEYTVLITNRTSLLNKKLIKYFHKNLTPLNKKGICFEWISVHNDEMEYYEDQGITKFPTMVVDSKNITGVTGIISFLDKVLTRSVKKQSDSIHEYMVSAINEKDDDDDEDDYNSFSKNIHTKMAEMQAKRKSRIEENNEEVSSSAIETFKDPVKEKKLSEDVSNPVDLIKSGKKNNPDDELLEKFWSNMEATDM